MAPATQLQMTSRDQTMRIGMEIGVEHAASGEPFDHPQLLNPKQHKRRPDVIEELDGNKQNPERNFVLLTLSRESNTLMPDKHFSI